MVLVDIHSWPGQLVLERNFIYYEMCTLRSATAMNPPRLLFYYQRLLSSCNGQRKPAFSFRALAAVTVVQRRMQSLITLAEADD